MIDDSNCIVMGRDYTLSPNVDRLDLRRNTIVVRASRTTGPNCLQGNWFRSAVGRSGVARKRRGLESTPPVIKTGTGLLSARRSLSLHWLAAGSNSNAMLNRGGKMEPTLAYLLLGRKVKGNRFVLEVILV